MDNLTNWLQPGETLVQAVAACVRMGNQHEVMGDIESQHILWSGGAVPCIILAAVNIEKQFASMKHLDSIDLNQGVENCIKDFLAGHSKLKTPNTIFYIVTDTRDGLNKERCDAMKRWLEKQGYRTIRVFKSKELAIDSNIDRYSIDFDNTTLPR